MELNQANLDANLLPGGGKKTKSSAEENTSLHETQAPHKLQRGLKMGAYLLIATVSLLFFYIIKLPADLIGRNALALLSQQTPYEWRAEKTKISFILGPQIIFENMNIIHRYPSVSGTQQKFHLEKLSIKPNLLAMIPIPGMRSFSPSASFSLEAFQGKLSGSIRIGASMIIDLEGEKLRLDKMDFLRTMNLALKGEISSLHLQLEAPNSRFSLSQGLLNLSIKNAHMDPSTFSQGMPIPELDLGNASAKATIKNGKLTIEKFNIGSAGADLELQSDGFITLKDPIDYSDLDLHFRLKLSDKLAKAAPSLEGMLPLIAAKRSDGFYGAKVTGPLIAQQMPIPYAGN